MGWFFNKKSKTKDQTQNQVERQKILDQIEERQRENKELGEKTINIGVKAVCSTEMSPAEKEDILVQVIESIRENFPEENEDMMYQLAKRSYEFQIENFTENQKLNELIRIKYEIFNRSWSSGDVNDLGDYGFIDLLDYSTKQAELPQAPAVTKIVSYSTNSIGKFNFQITGTKYVDPSAWDILKSLSKGDILSLVAEPDNPYDSDAIAIYHEDVKLGHVPREVNREMRSYTDNPAEDYDCIFSNASDHEVPYTWVNCYLKKS